MAFVKQILEFAIERSISVRDVTDFESDGYSHFFTNPNLSDLQTQFLTDSDLIFVLNFRKINCCLLRV